MRLNPEISVDKCGHNVKVWTKCGQKGTRDLLPSAHPTPLPNPNECKHYDYGLQYKITVKRIFTLFFTNMVVEGCLTVNN